MKLHERLFIILLALYPIQLAKHFWPSWSFIIGRRIDYLSPTVYLTDIILGLLFFTWILGEQKIVVSQFRRLSLRSIFSPLCFLSITVINILFTGHHPETWLYWIKLWEFGFFIFYITRTRPPFSRIVGALSIAAFYSSLLALSEFILQRSVGGMVWWAGERQFSILTPGIARTVWCVSDAGCRLFLRPYATFPHPNVLGGFLAVTTTLLLGYISIIRRRIPVLHKIWYGFVCGISFVALLSTVSRSAWISVIAGLSLLACFIFRSDKQVRYLAIGLFFIATLLSVSVHFIPILSDESVVERLTLQGYAISLWKKSPLIGIGGARFLPSIPTITMSRAPGFLQPVHSIYLSFLTEIGMLGLTAFLIVVLFVGRRIYTIWKQRPGSYSDMRRIAGVALFQLLIIGLVDHYPVTLQQGQLLFSLLLGISLITPHKI